MDEVGETASDRRGGSSSGLEPKATQEEGNPRRRWVVVAMGLGMGMVSVDVTGVSVALPNLQRSLGLSDAAAQWTMTAYLVGVTAFLITGGRMGDLFGRKKLFVCGVLGFLATSVLCGLSQGATSIILARAFQGVSAGFMLPGSMALIASAVPLAERAKAMGVWGTYAAVATAIGPVLGGVLVDTLGFRAVFFANVPIGIACLLLTSWASTESRAPSSQRRGLDIPGLLMLTVGLVALTVAVSQGGDWGFGSAPVVICFALFGVVTPAFIYRERRAQSPLVSLDLFRLRSFVGANILGFLLIGLFYVFIVHVASYLQMVTGLSSMMSGVWLLAFTVGLFVGSRSGGFLTARRGPRFSLAIGSVLMAVGSGMLCFLGVSTGAAYLWGSFGILGFGLMTAWVTLGAVVVNSVGAGEVGAASGINMMFRDAGGAIMLAVALAVSQGLESAKLNAVLPNLAGEADTPHGVRAMLANPQQLLDGTRSLSPVMREEVLHAAKEAVSSGVSGLMVLAFAASVGCLGVTLLTIKGPARG